MECLSGRGPRSRCARKSGLGANRMRRETRTGRDEGHGGVDPEGCATVPTTPFRRVAMRSPRADTRVTVLDFGTSRATAK